MRIFPIVLILIGGFGLLRHYGYIDREMMQLLWPLLLIGIGVALLVRKPRWRVWGTDRWERRMARRFGPAWVQMSDEERARFRADGGAQR
ncbi:DUF5668 domain-containing protein [uncultured Aquincola sp.]|uniref:LiaI-LiaF-like domain-containing protein n=1 Tax=uncultured Aquincola sp. TaxID=886556 RepID=UPI0032B2DEF6